MVLAQQHTRSPSHAALLVLLFLFGCAESNPGVHLGPGGSSSGSSLSSPTPVMAALHASTERLLSSRRGTTYLHADRLNSITTTTNSAGQLHGHTSFTPFGEVHMQGGVALERSFTGQERDGASGLLHFTYREFDPKTGRWTSPDPLFAQLKPTALHQHGQTTASYAYVANDPVGAPDPTGLVRVTTGKSTQKLTVMRMPQRPQRRGFTGFLKGLFSRAPQAQAIEIDKTVTNYQEQGGGTYYHVTSQKNVDSILKAGLQTSYGGSDKGSSGDTGGQTTGSKETSKGHVYFWGSKANAKGYAKAGFVDKPVILELNIPNGTRFHADPELAAANGNANKNGAFRTTTSISKDNISVSR